MISMIRKAMVGMKELLTNLLKVFIAAHKHTRTTILTHNLIFYVFELLAVVFIIFLNSKINIRLVCGVLPNKNCTPDI